MKTLKNWLLKRLFCAVVPEDIITSEVKGDHITQVYIRGEKITPQQLKNLSAEVAFLQESEIWKIMTDTVTSQSNERMFKNAKVIDDMMFGKASLYTIDLQKNILETIKRFSQLL
jgi:hypothetical protein